MAHKIEFLNEIRSDLSTFPRENTVFGSFSQKNNCHFHLYVNKYSYLLFTTITEIESRYSLKFTVKNGMFGTV